MNAPSAFPAAAEAVDVILRDGGTLRLRPPTSVEAEEVVDFFTRLSPESMWLRFHGARRVTSALVQPFLDPDWSDRGSLAGFLATEDGQERIVALASYGRLPEP